MNSFHSFSLTHLAAIVGVVVPIALFVACGRAWHGARQRRLELGVAAAILLLRAGILVWNFLPSHFAVVHSLPLQICDLAAICSALALIVDKRWLASIAYFWGLALSVQGLIQPDLQGGAGTLGFWLFWLHHALIVGTALYLVFARGFRPSWRDFVLALRAGVIYAAAIFAIDFAFDVNYGYLGRALPAQPTLLDWLGPWPWRAVAIAALGATAMWLLLVPWLLRPAPGTVETTRERGRPTV